MKLNKKADGDLFFIICILILFFMVINAINEKEYASFIRDCESNDINKDLFTYNYNATCYKGILLQNNNFFDCNKNIINESKLNLYCQNKYLNNKE